MNLSIVGNIEIIIPSIDLQTRFAKIVENTETLKAQYNHSLNELENLYGSLSQKAFKDELSFEDEKLMIAAEPKASYIITQSSIPDRKLGFAKQVLGGKIVSLFKDDKNFSHIKFQNFNIWRNILPMKICFGTTTGNQPDLMTINSCTMWPIS